MVHPLLLPNVLGTVFAFCSQEDLKHFRMVNTDWNHAACIVISKCQIVKCLSIAAFQRYSSIFTQSSPYTGFDFHLKISEIEYNQIISFLSGFHAQSIRSVWVTVGPEYFNSSQMQGLLKILQNLEYLGIRFHYFKCNALEESSSRLIMKSFPSLKGIHVEIHSYDVPRDCVKNLLYSIFDHAPNLSMIIHPMFCTPPSQCRIPSQINTFLTELVLDESCDSLAKLTHFDFIMKVNEHELRTLIGKKYPLKQLYLNLWCPEDESCATSSSLKLLVSQLSVCLEKLGIEFPWSREVAYDFTFPFPMKTLVYLSLNGVQCSLIRLLDKLPKLRQIELSQVDLFDILPANEIIRSYPALENLRLDFCTNQVPGVASRLSRIFPSLRSLDINHATDSVCRMIFKKMNNLECLKLEGDELTDEGLTGIPSTKEHVLINSSVEQGNKMRSFSFLGDLTKLKELKLIAYQLTEACVKHAIVHCINLQFVSMDTRLEKDDPTSVTRTLRLSEYGKRLLDGEKEVIMIFKEDVETDQDEDAVNFFNTYEKGLVTDLLFS